MSERLFDECKYTSADTWLTQITRDLKGKTVSEMDWSPDGQLRITPYVHAEIATETTSSIETFGTWNIGEEFMVKDAVQSNQHILQALNGGVESIKVHCTADIQWDLLFRDIELPFIHLGLNTDGDAMAVERFFNYALSRFPNDTLRVTLHLAQQVQSLPVRYCIPASGTDSFVDQLVSAITNALQFGKQSGVAFSLLDLSISVDMAYLAEIAKLRALRTLWQNVAEALQFDMSAAFAIEAYTVRFSQGDDPHSHLIKSTVSALAAVLGAADRIYVSPASDSKLPESFYRHLSRNMHHLLRYESKFTEIDDPVASAYYFDKLTQELVEKAWAKLLQRL